jgi:hypothetical protein
MELVDIIADLLLQVLQRVQQPPRGSHAVHVLDGQQRQHEVPLDLQLRVYVEALHAHVIADVRQHYTHWLFAEFLEDGV